MAADLSGGVLKMNNDIRAALMGDRDETKLTHLSLFSGIGGLDLAAEWAGFETVGQCEWADYPTKVLEKHWPNVPRWRDIRNVTGIQVAEKCGKEITVLSGGFPCQPHSLAGKRLASGDKRDLWRELARIIREVRPKWVVAENVPGILSSEHGRFFGRVLRDLANMGYDAGWGVFSAFQAGMEHERKRVFIVAHTNRIRWNGMDDGWEKLPENNEVHICEERKSVQAPNIFEYALRKLSGADSELLRKDDGVPVALDRLKSLGNAVVPQQGYPIFRAIADIERGIVHG